MKSAPFEEEENQITNCVPGWFCGRRKMRNIKLKRKIGLLLYIKSEEVTACETEETRLQLDILSVG